MVYFDNAASTPVCNDALDAMNEYLKKGFANPSSLHSYGREAREKIDEARKHVADLLHANAEEIIFTSGATEANNLAIRGTLLPLLRQGIKLHAVTTAIEHASVTETLLSLQKDGLELTIIRPAKNGVVTAEQVLAALRPETALVSVMMVNNEVGSDQPTADIAKVLKGKGIIFHTDAVQGVVSHKVSAKDLGVDLLTISGHKIGAPKGIGALYVRKGVELEPLITGGGHECNVRSGTENSPGIIALGAAAERLKFRGANDLLTYLSLRDAVIDGLREKRVNAKPLLSKEGAVPNILSLECPGQTAEFVMLKLDRLGIAVAAGSACKSGDRDASPILLAMGVPKERARSVIRVSFGPQNTKEDADEFVRVLGEILAKRA